MPADPPQYPSPSADPLAPDPLDQPLPDTSRDTSRDASRDASLGDSTALRGPRGDAAGGECVGMRPPLPAAALASVAGRSAAVRGWEGERAMGDGVADGAHEVVETEAGIDAAAEAGLEPMQEGGGGARRA